MAGIFSSKYPSAPVRHFLEISRENRCIWRFQDGAKNYDLMKKYPA
jgi:hypothetical protein